MFPHRDSQACDLLIKNLGKKELGNIFNPGPLRPHPPPPKPKAIR